MVYPRAQRQFAMPAIFGRTRPWMWWTLAGLAGSALAVWALIATFSNEDLTTVRVGQVVTLDKTGVAITKGALGILLRSTQRNNRAVMIQLVSAGQVFTPAIGTAVKVTYLELFQDTMVFQVVVQNGRYKGRTGWIAERQIHSATPLPSKESPAGDPNIEYSLPAGMDTGFGGGGLGGGVEQPEIPKQ